MVSSSSASMARSAPRRRRTPSKVTALLGSQEWFVIATNGSRHSPSGSKVGVTSVKQLLRTYRQGQKHQEVISGNALCSVSWSTSCSGRLLPEYSYAPLAIRQISFQREALASRKALALLLSWHTAVHTLSGRARRLLQQDQAQCCAHSCGQHARVQRSECLAFKPVMVLP